MLQEPQGTPDIIFVSTGSEVGIAVQAADMVKDKKVRPRAKTLTPFFLTDRWTDGAGARCVHALMGAVRGPVARVPGVNLPLRGSCHLVGGTFARHRKHRQQR